MPQFSLNTNGFSLGDRILGMKTGHATPSTIVGFVIAPLTRFVHEPCVKWDVEYPDWQDKIIAYTVFDQPTRPYTFEEFKTNRHMTPNELLSAIGDDERLLLAYYETDCKPMVSVAYPIDDLKLW